MAKSNFTSKGSNSTDNVFAQNDKAMTKPSTERFVDGPILSVNPYALFDEKTKFAGGDKQNIEATSKHKSVSSPSEILSAYPLSSGATSKAEVRLFPNPLMDTVVWEGNPRTQSERDDTSDIDESIITNGLNVIPAIARNRNGVIEIIEGSRRRESCAKNHKPLLAIVVENMSDDDAKIITIFGNEGRKDTNVFSRIDGYKLLLEGDRPLCRSKADLARRLGLKRVWMSQLMSIGDIPNQIRHKLTFEEVAELTAKRAIKLYKAFSSLSESDQGKLLKWAVAMTEVTVQAVLDKSQELKGVKVREKAKIGTMNIVSRHDDILIVKNNNTAGIFIQLSDTLNVEDIDNKRLKVLLGDAQKSIK
jgi:ParB/RepB/Spo0J family partition protein